MAEKFAAKYISIHALREEGDVRQSVSRFTSGISIHALREEDDRVSITGLGEIAVFLSTPSARRATREKMDLDMQVAFLSTPSVKRATDGFY